MNNSFFPEGNLLDTLHNKKATSSLSNLEEAAANGDILEGYATSCDVAHNITVNLGGIRGIIPRDEGAIGIKEGLVRDIALISRVGKPVSFICDGFAKDKEGNRIAILSRRKAQERCQAQYISSLLPGDIISAKVTHLESFGAFCDIGCGIIALLPIDTISVSRISHPSDRFRPGDSIKAVVKSIIDGKITLSMKELLGTWEQNAEKFSQGETVSGIVRSVEDYGIFVELAPNLAGLAESKKGVNVGEITSVYIKSILPEKMKVKLIIIDSFAAPVKPSQPQYFLTGSHIDYWKYSPDCATKEVFSEF